MSALRNPPPPPLLDSKNVGMITEGKGSVVQQNITRRREKEAHFENMSHMKSIDRKLSENKMIVH